MAKNLIHDYTRTITLPLPAGTKPGQPVKVGDFIGTAVHGVPTTAEGGKDGDLAAVAVDGVWEQPVTGAVTQVGSKVYLVAADNTLSTTASGNSFYGYALQLKPAAAGPLRIHVPGV